MINKNLVLISGESATGKSRCLKYIDDPGGVLYLNCESGKQLPFKSGFIEKSIVDPNQIFQAFEHANTQDHIHTIVIDTLTYLMDMYETLFVYNSSNTQGAWNDYQQYFKTLMQQYVASSKCNVIFLGHTSSVFDNNTGEFKTTVPVKGALAKNGIESFFSIIISTKRVKIKELDKYPNELLNISDKERRMGYKYVFQTQITENTTGERIRGPEDLFSEEETYIDNDVSLVLKRIHEYYK